MSISWTQCQNMTKAQTKRLFTLVNRLMSEKRIGMSYSSFYQKTLAELKAEFPNDAQDFIDYYKF